MEPAPFRGPVPSSTFAVVRALRTNRECLVLRLRSPGPAALPLAAVEDVGPGTTVAGVLALSTVEVVVTRTAAQVVLATLAVQVVVPRSSTHGVLAGAPVEEVRAGVAADGVVALTTRQLVGTIGPLN